MKVPVMMNAYSSAIMELTILSSHCGDMKIEPVPDARLYAEHLPGQTTAIAGSVFRCSRWHIFATFAPPDPSRPTE